VKRADVVHAAEHPALDRLATVAAALGELRSRVVFIGGAIAPLLQQDPPFPGPRPTSDVDAVVVTASYAEAQRIRGELTARGFRQGPEDAHHVGRWIGPKGIPFDLVSVGSHVGASGSTWDALAVQTAVEATLASGVSIRHASGPGFLALKWVAYQDRGSNDPLNSEDLGDILALIASRPSLAEEVSATPAALRTFIADEAVAFLTGPYVEDLMAAHLNNAQNPAATITTVRSRLQRLVDLRTT
jgi:predicted nucleotidyltransferase